MPNISLVHAMLGAAIALGTQSVAAQGKPKPPADKAPTVQEKRPAITNEPLPIENFHAQCIGCHGIAGYKTAYPEVYHVPKIAGQQPGYIIAALKAYKAGDRSHPSMRGIAASLTEDQMKELAEYYGAPAK
ncbi:MAG: cytochrome c [Burkholderiales bacterium]